MKKITILLGLMMVVGLASLSLAGNPDSITLMVTPVTNVSVNIVLGSYNFTSVALYNGTTVNSTALEVKNDGSVNTKWQHKADLNTTGGVAWTLVYAGVAASTNQFRLWAEVAAAQPGSCDDDVAHRVTTTDADLTGASNVPPNPTGQSLWIKLEMPWATGDSSEHTATYTITASAI